MVVGISLIVVGILMNFEPLPFENDRFIVGFLVEMMADKPELSQ